MAPTPPPLTWRTWLLSNAVSLTLAVFTLGGGLVSVYVSKARADDRLDALARDLTSDKTALHAHELKNEEDLERMRVELRSMATLIRDAAWNGYYVCIAQAKRPDLECSKPDAPR